MKIALLLKETMINKMIRLDKIQSSNQSDKEEIKIWAQIEFGVLSKDCNNFGICKIHQYSINFYIAHTNSGCNCSRSTASITFSSKEGLSMCFYKDLMSEKVRKNYFSNASFQMDEAFKVPTGLAKQLNCKSFILDAGYHPVTETTDTYVINFNQLKNNKIYEP